MAGEENPQGCYQGTFLRYYQSNGQRMAEIEMTPPINFGYLGFSSVMRKFQCSEDRLKEIGIDKIENGTPVQLPKPLVNRVARSQLEKRINGLIAEELNSEKS